MFVQAVPSSPTVSTSSVPASPTGLPRPSRLRGLSYLRTYTQNHLSSLSQQSSAPPSRPSSVTRATSYPAHSTLLSDDPPLATTTPSVPNRGRVSIPNTDSVLSESDTSSRQQTSGEAASEESPDSAALSRIMARHRAGSVPQVVRRGQPVSVNAYTAAASHHSRSNGATYPNEFINSSAPPGTTTREVSGLAGLSQDQMPTIKFIPHQDPRAARPSLAFAPTSRTLPHEDCVIRVGRYSEKDGNLNPPPNAPSSAPVGFKSKVVSRRHCEFWCSQGQWYIRDVKSSSGTFLNHIRLSQPSVESKTFPVNDGDVVQLGIDFRGGEEMIFRCVKIRIECNRAWQKGLNNFNVTTHKRLRALAKPDTKKDSDTASTHSSECAICLMSIAPCQSLFVAPCSHVWHYKCIRPILNNSQSNSQFLCPNCRAVADLEADVDDPYALGEWDDDDAEDGESDPEISQICGNVTNEASINDGHAFEEDTDEALAANARHLSISNLVNSSEPSSPTLSNRPNVPTAQSLLSRRMGNRPLYGAIGEPPSASSTGGTLNQVADQQDAPSQQNYLFRPITPDQQTAETHTEERTPRASSQSLLRAPAPTATEILVTEGPMTPRNDIGPFVFDGSAGRRARAAENGVSGVEEEGELDDI